MSACRPSAVTVPAPLRGRAPTGLEQSRSSHGAAQVSGLGDFFDNLAIETPAMRAVHRMAQQIREQEG